METIDLLRELVNKNDISMANLFDLYQSKKRAFLENLFFHEERYYNFYKDDSNYADFKRLEENIINSTYVLIYTNEDKNKYHSLGWKSIKEMKGWIAGFKDTKNFSVKFLIKDGVPVSITTDTVYVRTFTVEE